MIETQRRPRVEGRGERPETGKPTPSNAQNPLPDMTAEKLLRRAVANCRDRQSRKGEKHPRWVAVMDTFALGSTYAAQLCRWAGFDPDELVKR